MIWDVAAWLGRTGLCAVAALQLALVITALRAFRWVGVPEVTWHGTSQEDAARSVSDHIANVRDTVFWFPSGVFIAHASTHRPDEGSIRMREASPRYGRQALVEIADTVAEAIVEIFLGLVEMLSGVAAWLGFFAGIVEGGAVLGIGRVIGAVLGAPLGALAGFLLVVAVGVGLGMLLFCLVAASALTGWMFTLLYVPLLRSRIEATVAVTGAHSRDVRIAIRFRGLSAYAVQRPVVAALQAPITGDQASLPGSARLTRLAFQGAALAVIMLGVGLVFV